MFLKYWVYCLGVFDLLLYVRAKICWQRCHYVVYLNGFSICLHIVLIFPFIENTQFFLIPLNLYPVVEAWVTFTERPDLALKTAFNEMSFHTFF